jgi:MscS family membrane protein
MACPRTPRLIAGGRTGALALSCLLSACALSAQTPATAPRAAAAEPARDTLGRDTPRGTVLGFMAAARAGNDEVSPLYMNTPLRGRSAIDLARQLFAVLDARLPARLVDLSDRPEGSRVNPLKPDQDVVGTIATDQGKLEVVVERVNRGALGPVWLFSRRTLESIPDAYDEIDLVSIDRYLPAFLVKPRLFGIRLFEWLALLVLVPAAYRLTAASVVATGPLAALWRRRRGLPPAASPFVLPGSIRLLVLAVVIRWLVAGLDLPLIERLMWSGVGAMLAIVAVVWSLLLLNAAGERYLCRRLRSSGVSEMSSLLRLGRRIADVFVIVAGGLVVLRRFGIDATAALAGLGIGGIAVALAAQKTLENVIGGLSLIFDKAVRVGDFLKFGDTLGTVDYIGLRSTRIRTLDRTILSVPNGQVANASIETLSSRDKFWFHHIVHLRYETTSAQLRVVIDAIRDHLAGHAAIDSRDVVRVRLLRFADFSFDVEVFAYILAADWELFLAAQQQLLLDIVQIVEQAGSAIALPSQTLHFEQSGSLPPGAALS